MFGLTYLPGVVTLQLDPSRCNGCGRCLEVCPRTVFARRRDRVGYRDRDACMECGACALNCPEGALSVEAGVGCAQAVINAAVGRSESGCCCGDQRRSDPHSASCC